MNKKILLILLILILIVSCQSKNDFKVFNNNFEQYNFKLINEFNNEKIFQGKYLKNIIKLKNIHSINDNMMSNKKLEKLFFIETLYRDINSPYPGSVSNKISCQEKYKPQEIENHYELYSNERLNYGVCSEDLIKYKTYLQFLKCNEEFYTIELFIPIDQKIEFIEFECK